MSRLPTLVIASSSARIPCCHAAMCRQDRREEPERARRKHFTSFVREISNYFGCSRVGLGWFSGYRHGSDDEGHKANSCQRLPVAFALVVCHRKTIGAGRDLSSFRRFVRKLPAPVQASRKGAEIGCKDGEVVEFSST